MNVSRRRILQVLPAAVALPAEGQDAPQQRTEDEEARQRLRASAQIVRQVDLPTSAEPAFKFVPRN